MSLPVALDRVARLVTRFPEGFPSACGQGHRYHRVGNEEWTPGFWTGLLWLAYQRTGERLYRDRAAALIPGFAARLDTGGPGVETHDLGFLYMLSCHASWLLTGAPESRGLTLRAADLLAARAWPQARVIQAWGSLDDPDQQGRIIIDSVMNMPLLFTAAQERDRHSYRGLAVDHLDRCAELLVRPDGSTAQTCVVDVRTGRKLHVRTHQGLSDQSCWARGQAWALYGFALAFRYTQEERFRETAQAVARYFLDHLSEDGLCVWDLDLRDDATQERDSSAAAIAVCGLLELSGHLPVGDRDRVSMRGAALALLDTLASRCLATDSEEDGLLRGGVYNRPRGIGVNECCLWGDYFFLEALLRRGGAWTSFW